MRKVTSYDTPYVPCLVVASYSIPTRLPVTTSHFDMKFCLLCMIIYTNFSSNK